MKNLQVHINGYNKIKLFFKSINPWLIIVFGISISIVFSMDMWLLTVPAPSRFFEAFGKISYGISLSYIAAFIFYLISVHYPETKSAIAVYKAAHSPAKAIVSNIEQIFVDMGRKLGMCVDHNSLNQDIITKILNHTKCFSLSSLAKENSFRKGTINYYTWIEYLEFKTSIIEGFYKELRPFFPKLDAEYIGALSNVEQDNGINTIISLVNFSIKTGQCVKDSMYFDDGLEDILIAHYRKAIELRTVILEREKVYINNE